MNLPSWISDKNILNFPFLEIFYVLKSLYCQLLLVIFFCYLDILSPGCSFGLYLHTVTVMVYWPACLVYPVIFPIDHCCSMNLLTSLFSFIFSADHCCSMNCYFVFTAVPFTGFCTRLFHSLSVLLDRFLWMKRQPSCVSTCPPSWPAGKTCFR